jgi:hypothetical protein
LLDLTGLDELPCSGLADPLLLERVAKLDKPDSLLEFIPEGLELAVIIRKLDTLLLPFIDSTKFLLNGWQSLALVGIGNLKSTVILPGLLTLHVGVFYIRV